MLPRSIELAILISIELFIQEFFIFLNLSLLCRDRGQIHCLMWLAIHMYFSISMQIRFYKHRLDYLPRDRRPIP